MPGDHPRPDGTVMEQEVSAFETESDGMESQAECEHKSLLIFLLLVVAYFSANFGHGSTIGVAVSLKGDSKAINLSLSSWTTAGLLLGLIVTPWASRTWGVFRLWTVCMVIDILVIMLMMWPGITIQQIYVIRFLIGFFEAPFLPYLQEWLAHFANDSWNIWNAIMHATIPIGENLGYLVAQELVVLNYNWQYAFAGQAACMSLSLIACCVFGGRKFLELSHHKHRVAVADDPLNNINGSDACGRKVQSSEIQTSLRDVDFSSNADSKCHMNGDAESEFTSSRIDEESTNPADKYPTTERWAVFWACNVSLAAQVAFLVSVRLVIRDYSVQRGFTSVHFTVCAMSFTSLVGPVLGGSLVTFCEVVKPDHWSQHKKTLLWLACTSSVASALAVLLPYTSPNMFWPAMFLCYAVAGGVYPAAQGIINIALTATRVVESSVYQMQCSCILCGIPLPYLIGKSIDVWGASTSFQCVMMLQVIAASGFALALLAAACQD